MLLPKYLHVIKSILYSKLDPKQYSVFIFGSRATNTDQRYSDVDIGIEGKPVDPKTKMEIQEKFEESNLPYNVDIVDFSSVHDKFKQIALQKIIRL